MKDVDSLNRRYLNYNVSINIEPTHYGVGSYVDCELAKIIMNFKAWMFHCLFGGNEAET